MAIAFSAYSVYWYDTSEEPAVGYGMAGRIIDSGAVITPSPGMRADLNGDPKVEGFVDAVGNLRVAVTDRDAAGGLRDVYIHNAVLGTQVGSAQSWPEKNLYTLVKFNGYLYAIDYDGAKVIEIDATAPYAATGVSYPLDPSFIPQGYQAVGQALVVANGHLYGLFSFPDSTWDNYAPSLIVRFAIALDPQTGKNVIDVDASNDNLAANAFSIASDISGNLYVAAIGGKQTAGVYNQNSRVQQIDGGLATVTDRVSPNGTYFPYPFEFRDISFKGATAYILTGAYDTGWKLRGRLVSTADFENFTLIDDFANPSVAPAGSFWTAKYTPDNDRLWYGRGNAIRVYNASALTPTPPAPLATLTVAAGSLISQGDQYTDLNDLTYVGKAGTFKLSGYRSPLQRSNTRFARAARALTQGRPELTEEEFAQLAAIHGLPGAYKAK